MAFKPFLILAVLLAALVVGCTQAPQEKYSVSDYGLVSYASRNPPQYTKTFWNSTGHSDIYRISYSSRNATIFALLSVPKGQAGGRHPAFVVLPAAGVTKEGEQQFLSQDLNKLGFITLTLDTRGQGESQTLVYGLEQDYNIFVSGGEPVSHKMVYDALAAYDILKGLPEADSSKIYAAGESAGGRTAVIAAAIEPGIKGLLAISTSGYDFAPSSDTRLARFENSVNPSKYISRLSPRPLIQMHSSGDKIIPISLARQLFAEAGEPRKFLEVAGDTHGYYRDGNQQALLEAELGSWL